MSKNVLLYKYILPFMADAECFPLFEFFFIIFLGVPPLIGMERKFIVRLPRNIVKEIKKMSHRIKEKKTIFMNGTKSVKCLINTHVASTQASKGGFLYFTN